MYDEQQLKKLIIIRSVSSYMINYLKIKDQKLKYLAKKLYCLSSGIEMNSKPVEEEEYKYTDIKINEYTILREVEEEDLIIRFYMEFLHEFLDYQKNDDIKKTIEEMYFEIDKKVNANIELNDLKETKFYILKEFEED